MFQRLLVLLGSFTAAACSSTSGGQAISVCDLYSSGVTTYSQPAEVRLSGCYSKHDVHGEVIQLISSDCGTGAGCPVIISGIEHSYERYVRLRSSEHHEVGAIIEVAGDLVVRASPVYDGPVYAFVLTVE